MVEKIDVIGAFRGKYAFLSNFYRCEIKYRGKIYPTLEHCYQSIKVIDEDLKEEIRIADTPTIAKSLGNKGKKREDWGKVKEGIMKELLLIKFSNSHLKDMLLQTEGYALVEGNYWHDNTWGNCWCNRCKKIDGKNLLGKLLMEVRNEIK